MRHFNPLTIAKKKEESLDNLVDWIFVPPIIIPLTMLITKKPVESLEYGGIVCAVPIMIYFGKYAYYREQEEKYNEEHKPKE